MDGELSTVVVQSDQRDLEIERLRASLRQEARQRADAERAAERAREDAQRALSMLRTQLGPLYRALQAVFGELDAAGVTSERESGPQATAAPSQHSAVWEAWKAKLGSAGKVIDALLLHKEMNTQQLAIATGLHRTTIPALIYKLNQAGLLNKRDGKFSLKPLA